MKQLEGSSPNCSLRSFGFLLIPVNSQENKESPNLVLNYYAKEGHSLLQKKQTKNISFATLKQWPCSCKPTPEYFQTSGNTDRQHIDRYTFTVLHTYH